MAVQGSTVLARVINELSDSGADVTTERVQLALDIAREAYGDDMHWSGETLQEHVAGVLYNLQRFQPDEDAIIACILHHVLQAEDWTLNALEEQFGSKVRSLVSGAHLLSHVTVQGRRTSIDDLRLMLLTVSDDMRTILINLCDRCYLLQRVHKLDAEDQRRICQDVLNLFAPVAARLGIYTLKHELESRAFPILYPNDAERIENQIQDLDKQYGDFLESLTKELNTYLQNNSMNARVVYRQKQSYSLFSKMKQKSLTHVQDVYDLFAIRVIVPTIEECYQVLGLLHRVGRPVAHRFKDYISFPKPNGYQSLHTTLAQLPAVPQDILIEVQVRTEEMHRECEYGIAAHWSYKTYGDTDLAAYHAQLHQMLVSQETIAQDGMQHLADHIFVLTPKGDVIELPEGANPLDFAFMVHTDVGLSFRGAKVNGSMVPSNYHLENGDIVEILRHKTPQPSEQWMQTLTLSSARSKLKRYIYAKQRPQLIMQGRALLNEELAKHHLPVLDAEMTILKRYKGENLTTIQREDLLMKLGQSAEKASALLQHLDEVKNDIIKPQNAVRSTRKSNFSDHIHFADGLRMPTKFAKCCKPDSGKRGPILGVASRAGVVMIHRKICRCAKQANPDRILDVSWK